MLRCPLESIALRIKTLRLGTIETFLAKAIEPPQPDAIKHVIQVLSGLSALDVTTGISKSKGEEKTSSGKKVKGKKEVEGTEELTPLGVLLASLPVDPRIGKMMLYGSIFRCLESTLIIAASLAFRSPFFSPYEKRAEADAVKKSYDPLSDHMTLLMAFNGWNQSRNESRAAEREYLHANFLSRNTLIMIEKMKRQFEKILSDEGFFDRKNRIHYNSNSDNFELVKAVLVAGLYPNVVKVDLPGSGGGGRGNKKNSRPPQPKLKTRKLWEPGSKEEDCSLHPSSVLYGRQGGFGQPFLVFHEKVKTSQVYVRDATAVSPFALLLFGGAVQVEHLKGMVTLDNWLRFSVAAQHGVLIVAMRGKLMTIMKRKLENPKLNLFQDEESSKVIQALSMLVGSVKK
jgi:HrpA-like RNA helicase